MSENIVQPDPAPEVQDTRIITLLESNDVSISGVDGEWTNNLNENTILREGDSLTVRQSMIDTTSESVGLIDVQPEDANIVIQHGIYSVDAGDGTADNDLLEVGGQTDALGAYQHFSDQLKNHPSGDKYVLQNQSVSIANTKIFYYAGAGNSGVVDTINPPNPDSVPTSDFFIEMKPSAAGGLFEYTIETTAPNYVVPAGASPLPVPGTGAAPSPIIKPENLQGLNVILSHFTGTGNQPEVIWKLYYNGFVPKTGVIDPDLDHFATIETLYEPDVPGSATGYQSRNNIKFDNTRGTTPAAYNKLWVFRTATFPGGGGSAYQYWSNKDTTGKTSKIFKILKGFRMIVDDFSDFRDSKNRTNGPYSTQFTYTNHLGIREPVIINFQDWGNANEQVFGLVPANPGLFKQHVVNGSAYNLPDLNTAKGRKQAGWGGLSGAFFNWVQFTQLGDPKRANHITLPELTFDVQAGIEAFVFSGDRKAAFPFEGQAMGIYNQNNNATGQSYKFLDPKQLDTALLPIPPSGGALLQPRIFTTKFTIPAPRKYTYEALAQILTDRINQIPTKVTGQSNDPFPDDDDADPTALNIRGFSNSRFLTTTADLSMQQLTEPTIASRVPFFPSRFQYTNEEPPTLLLQPIWLSTDGTKAFQYDETALNGFDNPRWCGAESVSFLYDQSSDAFQVAQAHSNIYSRLDGGIIARQFRSNIDTGDNFRKGDLVTCDKAGGIFFTSLEPASLWYTKMKFKQQSVTVQQLGNNPTIIPLNTGQIVPDLNPANEMLANAMTHTLNLTEGQQITGNFLGTAINIDKRVRTFTNPEPPALPAVNPLNPGGRYQECNPKWFLDVATNTPLTIQGSPVSGEIVTDPFFQIEISGMNRQNIIGAKTKNSLIQSIVGKYFTNGGFTSGNIDDGFRYTHVGEPMLLKSLSVRILDSDGKPAEGLGPNSAVILELDTDK